MKLIIFCVFLTMIFIQGCQLYEHSNPLDPMSKDYKKDGTNAHFSIIGYNISKGEAIWPTFEIPYILKIWVINDGIGKTKTGTGKLYASIKTEPAVSFVSPWYSNADFINTANIYEINPKDILIGYFRFILPQNFTLPANINCSINLRDFYENDFKDSVVVNIKE